MNRTIFILFFSVACGDSSQTTQTSPQTAPTMAAEPVEQAPATMSVRSGPAKVPAEAEQQWQAALLRSQQQQQQGGGGMRREDHPFVDFIQDRADRMSGEEAHRLIKGMLNAGLQADSDDPCARMMAMIDHLGGDMDPEERRNIERECEREPSNVMGCLKPEDERTPYERRACRRFLTSPREDIPDFFGTNGAAVRGRQGAHPEGEGGPVRVEVPVPEN